jgi:predicted transcriptional regulator
MKMKEILTLLGGRLLCGAPQDDHEFTSAFASDMMSDVLAYGQGQSLLLTGLLNQQVIRTAEMLDMHCIIFVRGKRPDETVLSLARQKDITILATPYRMFTACGLLYENGLEGGCDVS